MLLQPIFLESPTLFHNAFCDKKNKGFYMFYCDVYKWLRSSQSRPNTFGWIHLQGGAALLITVFLFFSMRVISYQPDYVPSGISSFHNENSHFLFRRISWHREKRERESNKCPFPLKSDEKT